MNYLRDILILKPFKSIFFLQRAYKEVAKKLLPDVLFPTPIEYRKALEEYLSVHAPHFIDSIGNNSWVSLFSDKLLAEVGEISIFND